MVSLMRLPPKEFRDLGRLNWGLWVSYTVWVGVMCMRFGLVRRDVYGV
jgi:hypothetical protein